MKFERRFAPKAKRPYDGIEFETRTSIIKNSDGSSASQSIEVTVPSEWSFVASDILAQKYLRRAGLPKIGSESDARQVFHRLAGCWADWGKKHGYFDTEEDAQVFYDESAAMLARQVCAPNSPQWFNTGLHFAYGLKGNAQGHYYVDPKSGRLVQSKSAYERPQPHACFIQSVGDDLVNEGGIMDLWTKEARLFKYGSGTGTNFSHIRGSGEPLSGGGVSSGLMSFLKIGDRAAGAIKSGGTTRRAAKMVCLDLDHPDIEEFIGWKAKEEEKVAALVAGSKSLEKHLNLILVECSKPHDTSKKLEHFDPRFNKELRKAVKLAKDGFVPLSYIQRVLELAKQGITSLEIKTYDTDWNSESYQTVSGQNSNNSVRVPNDFMRAVQSGDLWQLKFRTNGQVCKELSARELWNDIAYAAWSCADPGIQFDTTINEWHTCPKDGPIRASNPCSEYMFLDDTACNLASLNLLKFYDQETQSFDTDLYIHAVRIWTVILDISVQMAQFPSQSIAQKSFDYRTLGLGYANIGALLMQMGIPYGNEEAMALTGALTAVLTGESYRTSAELAKELGAFPRYLDNRDDMLRVLNNHRVAATSSGEFKGLSTNPLSLDHSKVQQKSLSIAAQKVWNDCIELGEQFGFRNAQVSVVAPTGTIGLLMDCDTTGIEPDFSLVKFKKLAGGGYFKIINQSLPPALRRLGYSAEQITDIERYCLGHKTLVGCAAINHESLLKRGFTLEILEKLENEVKNCFDISFVFNPWSLGEDFCRSKLGLSEEKIKRSDLNLLLEMGFSREQISVANEYVCGTMTVEGAPHLGEEHLEVFDCANKCGAKGKRFIPYLRHINMMAAAQPFISGAISKTINLPYEATVEDVRKAHDISWSSSLKAIALYRDGSKLSQPLNSTTIDWERIFQEDESTISLEEPAMALQQSSRQEKVVKAAKEFAIKYISQRRPLPSRRSGYTQKVKIGGHSVYLRTGQYEDGKLGEIFLDINKEGTLLRSIMNCFAVSVSLGLQYGVPLEEFVDTFTFAKFEPNGLVLGHDNIKRSTSIIDFIFRDLAINYLERRDLAHVKPDEIDGGSVAARNKSVELGFENSDDDDLLSSTRSVGNGYVAQGTVETLHSDGSTLKVVSKPKAFVSSEMEFDLYAKRFAEAKMKGYEGDPCTECDSFTLVRNGACLKCDSCGTTTGCS